jgi:hypothetical protein
LSPRKSSVLLLLARTSFSWSAFNTFYPFRHQHYLHHQLKKSMGNFEVCAICYKLLALFPNGYDMLHRTVVKLIIKLVIDMFYFEETIIRKQFHSLVV